MEPYLDKSEPFDEKVLDNFQHMVKLLSFCVSLYSTKAPYFKQIETGVQALSKVPNSKMWSNWTPDQLNVLANADWMPQVVLAGGMGTGKTRLLRHQAVQKAKEIVKFHRNEKIFFVIDYSTKECTLLHMQLEEFFKQMNVDEQIEVLR